MIFSLFRRLTTQESDRRTEPRGSDIDGRIFIEGQGYPLRDWSRRGFSAGAYRAEHYPGDKVALSVEVDLDGEVLEFDCRAVVVWVDRDRHELAGVFTELDMRLQEKIMRSLFSRDNEAPMSPELHP
jgi:PilZ domain